MRFFRAYVIKCGQGTPWQFKFGGREVFLQVVYR